MKKETMHVAFLLFLYIINTLKCFLFLFILSKQIFQLSIYYFDRLYIGLYMKYNKSLSVAIAKFLNKV